MMKENREPVEVLSIAQFKSFYDLLPELIFLFSSDSERLIAGNQYFYDSVPLTTGINSKVTDFLLKADELLKIREGSVLNVAFQPKGEAKKMIRVRAYPATLEGSLVFIGIGEELQLNHEEWKEEQTLAEKERNALLSEVYHRVKNNLNIIVSLLSLQIKRIKVPEARELLQSSQNRVYVLALLQQKIYESPRISQIKAKGYLSFLCQRVVAGMKSPDKQISIITEIEDCWLDIDTLVPIGFITNELLMNSISHAFPSQENGEIKVELKRHQGSQFCLRVKDNGVGLPSGKAFHQYTETLGFLLVQSLCKQLKAEKVEATGSKGVDFHFYFEVKSYDCD